VEKLLINGDQNHEIGDVIFKMPVKVSA